MGAPRVWMKISPLLGRNKLPLLPVPTIGGNNTLMQLTSIGGMISISCSLPTTTRATSCCTKPSFYLKTPSSYLQISLTILAKFTCGLLTNGLRIMFLVGGAHMVFMEQLAYLEMVFLINGGLMLKEIVLSG